MLDDDGLPLDEVGPWAKDKHDRLRKYVDISRAARRKWIEGSSKSATYVDLFCGTGRSIIRDTNERSTEVRSSPSNPLRMVGFPFRTFTLPTRMKINAVRPSKELATLEDQQPPMSVPPRIRPSESRTPQSIIDMDCISHFLIPTISRICPFRS